MGRKDVEYALDLKLTQPKQMRMQVVTKRTKNLKKQEIPSLDDPISKLNHIGKETVKKLNELKASADEAQLQLPIPPELYRYSYIPLSKSGGFHKHGML